MVYIHFVLTLTVGSQGQIPDQSFQLKPSKTPTPLRQPAMYIVSVHDIEEHNHSATIPFGTKDSTSTSHRPLALVRRPKQRSIFSARRRKAGYDDDEMNEVELALKKPVPWLEDPDVVGSIMPETRVLHFTYPEPPEGELDWEAYIVNVATQLVGRLEDWQKTEGRKTPFLFVGHGIGGLVVQEAAILRAKSIDIAAGMEVGYIFLNTPFPTFEDGEPWHNNDNKAAEFWGFSRGQRIRRYDFIGRILASKGKFSVLSLWQDFVFATGGRVEEIPIAWLYRSDEVSQRH
jgi:pimeloyl-ACP methyl ester carboxylesterase